VLTHNPFEVVFVDRYAFHRHNTLAQDWNKMALPSFTLPHSPSILSLFRHALFESLSIPTPAKTADKVKIVYLDRQASSRRLRADDHLGLMDVLEDMARVRQDFTFVHAKLEEMDKRAQIEAMSDARVS
jgi:hypothetical protein